MTVVPQTAPDGDAAYGGCSAQAGRLDQIRDEIRRSRPGGLGEASTRRLLAAAGLPFVPSTPVTSEDHAAATAAAGGGGAAVLKAVSDEVLHKSDAGLVELNLAAPKQVRDAYRRLRARVAALGITDASIILQPMAAPGADLFAGWVRDPTFGPVIVTGLGGVNVELFHDVARAVPPLADADVQDMLGSLSSAPLLAGYRGAPAVDTTRFRQLVTTLGELALALPELTELDLNPVRVFADGRCQALDARAVLTPAPSGQAASAPVRQARLDALARPRSVAVIGASRDASRPGGRILRSLLEHQFRGPVYPVNPSGGKIAGLPAVASLTQLDELPDLACIALPAAASVEAVRECAARQVPAVIVYASGFSETGAAGRHLEDELQAAVAGSGTLLCGPNTIGIVSAHHRMAATFSRALEGLPLEPSGTCLIAQSGAVAGSLVSRELTEGYGIGDWVTVGNQSQLDVAAYIDYYAHLPTTKSIAVFLEGVLDGSSFRAALHTARAAGIPVAVFKTGLTDAGRKAVTSHSGALAGSGSVYRAVLAQEGVAQVSEMTTLLETAWVLGNSPRPDGRHVGVVTTSGGAGSAAADLVSQHGLELAEFTGATCAGLADVLPDFAAIGNPLDVTAEGAFAEGTVRRSVELMSSDPGVDLVCVVLTSITGADAVRIARQVADAVPLAQRAGKPVLVTWLVARPLAREGMELLARSGVRVFAEPARMIAAAAHLAAASRKRGRSDE